MTATEAGGELPIEAQAPGLTPMQRAKAILGGSAGNLVEWYDWFAYSSFALYFAKHFFPAGDRTAQLLGTAGVFWAGFLARPIGAWLMGLYADRAGRRAALSLSVAMMCAGSFAIAIMPDYSVIGAAAPFALLAARLVQGLSLGGEYGASATYMAEVAGKKNRGFWSSFQFMTLIMGQLTALAVLIVLQALLPKEALEAWAWRIPFVIGGALAIVVFWIRRGLHESASFLAVQKAGAAAEKHPPTLSLFLTYPRETWTIFGLTSAGSLAFYAYTTYMQKFLVNTAGFTKDAATGISAASLVAYMLIQPLYGALSDRIGRKTTLMFAFAAGTLATYPVMSQIAVTHDAVAAAMLIILLLAILSGYTAVNAVLKAELFPAHIRALGVALPYALANSIFGGSAEFAALKFKQAGHESGFYIYVAAVMAVAFLITLTLKNTNRHSLIAED